MPTIPDLQELSTLTTTSYFPVDSGIQSYKVSFANLIASLYKGFRHTITTKTANFNVVAADSFNLFLCNGTGGTFDATLPAVGAGLQFLFKKTDSTFTAISIKDASSTLVTTINTQNELVSVVANDTATGWIVGTRYIPSAWTAFTPTFNLSTQVGTKTGLWRRVGDSADLQFRVAFTGTNGQALAPTFTLPTGLVIDTTKLVTTTGSYASINNISHFVGTSITYTLALLYSSTTQITFNKVVSTTGTNQFIYQLGTTGSDLATATGNQLFCNCTIPIVGWNA